jgi:hypothetical protein
MPALKLRLYWAPLLQVTETGDAVLEVPPAKIRNPLAVAEAWQVAWTVAETPNEALAVAATAGLSVKPDTRSQKT